MRARAIAVLGISALAAPAAADDVVLPNTRAVLHVPADWTRTTTPPRTALIAGYRSDTGIVAAVTRAQVPNPDAWRAKTRDAYADQIERGVIAATRGRRRVRKLAEIAGVPALDLEVTRDTGALLVVRVLLFRTYALGLAIEVPAGGDPRAARGVAAGFGPPAEPSK